MDVVVLFSGGKDSVYAALEATRWGHRVVALANLRPAAGLPDAAAAVLGGATAAASCAAPERSVQATPLGSAPQELDSFLLQTVGWNVVPALAAAMGLPLVTRETAGVAVHTGLAYPAGAAAAAEEGGGAAVDEVEDLYALLRAAQAAHPSVRGCVVGAILSSYQRVRVEAVCARCALLPCAPLWAREQGALLRDMCASGCAPVLVKVASCGLTPRMLGRPLAALVPALLALARGPARLNAAGEGGEYETLCLDSPLHARGALGLRDARVEHGRGGVAHLRVLAVELLAPKGDAQRAADARARRADWREGGGVEGGGAAAAAAADLAGGGALPFTPPAAAPAPRAGCAALAEGCPDAFPRPRVPYEGLLPLLARRRQQQQQQQAAGEEEGVGVGALQLHPGALPAVGAQPPEGQRPCSGCSCGGCSCAAGVCACAGAATQCDDDDGCSGGSGSGSCSGSCSGGGGSGGAGAVAPTAAFSRVACDGDQLHVSSLSGCARACPCAALLPSGAPLPPPDAALVAQQTRAVLSRLRALLRGAGSDCADVAFVRVSLADCARDFGAFNAAYSEFWSGVHPPARSCVQAALCCPAALVALDCVAHRGSARAARAGRADARRTLHVASLSRWAPLCIGPYCQAVTLEGALVLAAGQIGLRPEAMALVRGGAWAQLRQALVNVARVLSAADSALTRCVSCVVYVADDGGGGAGSSGGGAGSSGGGAGSSGGGAGSSGGGGGSERLSAGARDTVRAVVAAWMCGRFGSAWQQLQRQLALAGDDDEGSDYSGVTPGGSVDGGDGGAAPETHWGLDLAEERDFPLGPAAHAAPDHVARHLPPRGGSGSGSGGSGSGGGGGGGNVGLDAFLCGEDARLPPAAVAACPLHPCAVLAVPALPRGAAVEVECVALTAHAEALLGGLQSVVTTTLAVPAPPPAGQGAGEGGALAALWAAPPFLSEAARLLVSCHTAAHYVARAVASVWVGVTVTLPGGSGGSGPHWPAAIAAATMALAACVHSALEPTLLPWGGAGAHVRVHYAAPAACSGSSSSRAARSHVRACVRAAMAGGAPPAAHAIPPALTLVCLPRVEPVPGALLAGGGGPEQHVSLVAHVWTHSARSLQGRLFFARMR